MHSNYLRHAALARAHTHTHLARSHTRTLTLSHTLANEDAHHINLTQFER